MTTNTTVTATKQVAINDIGSAEDFLAAVEKTLKFFNDGDLIKLDLAFCIIIAGDFYKITFFSILRMIIQD